MVRDACTFIFIIALFTIPKLWRQSACPSAGEWVQKNAVYMHGGVLVNHKGQSCWEMDATGGLYSKENKPDSENQERTFSLIVHT